MDSSALMAIVLREQGWEPLNKALLQADTVLISAATLAECLIVARRRGIGEPMRRFVDSFEPEVVLVDQGFAALVADAYDRFGRGVHPAGLNFGDCFAYALARARGAPLLFVGEDFAQTDVARAV